MVNYIIDKIKFFFTLLNNLLIDLINIFSIFFNETNTQDNIKSASFNISFKQLVIEIYHFLKTLVNILIEIICIFLDIYDSLTVKNFIKWTIYAFELGNQIIYSFFLILIIYFLIHGFLGLYSLYIDYLQKNSNYINDVKGFVLIFLLISMLLVIFIIFIFLLKIFLFYIIFKCF